jgi:hypothetical protein
MKKYLIGALFSVISLAGCGEDTTNPRDVPIALSATMKLAADSLNVALRVTNVSDTTQVLEWTACGGLNPNNFGVYRDAQLNNRVWEWRRMPQSGCAVPLEQQGLIPGQSFAIRGASVAVSSILGDSIAEGLYYIAVLPTALRIRPAGASYEMPIEAKVPVGQIELRRN